jgi:predicted ArsR family transcriptional regulator
MCDKDLLRLLADQSSRTIAEMAAHFCVTQTVIRRRLVRLTAAQSVTRQRSDDSIGKRGRPQYLYYITRQGVAALTEVVDEGIA